MKRLRRKGHADHVALATSLFPEIAAAFARPGDLAAVGTQEGPALGIVQGEHIYLAGEAGLRLVPLTDAVCAWRIG